MKTLRLALATQLLFQTSAVIGATPPPMPELLDLSLRSAQLFYSDLANQTPNSRFGECSKPESGIIRCQLRYIYEPFADCVHELRVGQTFSAAYGTLQASTFEYACF